MKKELGGLTGASISDIVNALGYATGSVAGAVGAAVIDRVMQRRASEARDIFLQEISTGEIYPSDPGNIDEFVAILYRYLRAAQEGTARLNLRLLARVVSSQLEGEGLYASDFLRYADLLSSLTREEVILLATRHRVRKNFEASRKHRDWSDAKQINDLVCNAVVPTLFRAKIELEAAMTSLQRTGMVLSAGIDGGSYDAETGGNIWIDAPLLDQIVTLAKIEGAIQEEDAPE